MESVGGNNSDKSKSDRFQWWRLWIQVGLLLATIGAFGAAAYYARIARGLSHRFKNKLSLHKQGRPLQRVLLIPPLKRSMKRREAQGVENKLRELLPMPPRNPLT